MADAKKYLEEVMGIVEDEKFNQERRLKRLKELKQKQRDKDGRGKKNIAGRHDDVQPAAEYQDEPSTCVKVVVDELQTNSSDMSGLMMIMMMLLQLVFVTSLLMFLVTGLVVASDYQSDDVLYLRRILRDDIFRLGFLFNTPGLQTSHWSVFDGLSWAAQTINSATKKLFMISKELFEKFESRKTNHDTNTNTNKESSTETENIKTKKSKNNFSEGKSIDSNRRNFKIENTDRNGEKKNHYENQDRN